MVKNKFVSVISMFTLFSITTTIFASSDDVLNSRANELEKEIDALNVKIAQIDKKAAPIELYAHGSAVVTSPVFGLYNQYSNGLMVNLPKINRDMHVLRLQQQMDKYAMENNLILPSAPIIALSGGVEGRFTYNDNANYSKTSKADFDLQKAELDVVSKIGTWVTGTAVVTCDKNPGYSSPFSPSVNKVSNSRLQVDRAFVSVGQLAKCPIYLSVGQLYAPFGIYSSFMVSIPLTKALGLVKDRMVILGYSKHELDAQVYGLSGSTNTRLGSNAAGSEIIKHGGIDINYKTEFSGFKVRIGGGILGNLAESERMQAKIFSGQVDWERIYSRVLGYNANIKLGYKNFELLAEYVGASTAFDVRDLPFNGSGAKPRAYNIEGAYRLNFVGKHSVIFAGYGKTEQALALSLPKASCFAGYSITLIKNILASIEYRHDINYGWNDTAVWPANKRSSITVNGRHSNAWLAQIGLYF